MEMECEMKNNIKRFKSYEIYIYTWKNLIIQGPERPHEPPADGASPRDPPLLQINVSCSHVTFWTSNVKVKIILKNNNKIDFFKFYFLGIPNFYNLSEFKVISIF